MNLLDLLYGTAGSKNTEFYTATFSDDDDEFFYQHLNVLGSSHHSPSLEHIFHNTFYHQGYSKLIFDIDLNIKLHNQINTITKDCVPILMKR